MNINMLGARKWIIGKLVQFQHEPVTVTNELGYITGYWIWEGKPPDD